MFDVTATIVTFRNDATILEKTIKSFLKTKLHIKLYIVDNSAEKYIKDICYKIDENISYIPMIKNIGFGAAHNYILNNKECLGKYHLVLNPDVRFENDVIEKIFNYMNTNEMIGNLMPKILYPNGSIQYLCKLLPTPLEWIGRMLIPSKKIKDKINYKFEMKFTDYNTIIEVPYLSGCFMFLRKSVIEEIGAFDEGIFMYGEDTDLNRRISQKYKTIYYPEVYITHEFAKGSHKEFRLFIIHIKAAIYYFNKWGWFFDKERRITNKLTVEKYKTK